MAVFLRLGAVLTGKGNYTGTYRIPFTIYQPVNLATGVYPAFRVQKYKVTLAMSGHSWTAELSTAASGSTDGIRDSAVCTLCGDTKPQKPVSAQKVMQIPAMMQTIEAEAFMATAAEQINVPDRTAKIGDKAFADCDDLKLVVIPASVTTIQGDPFSGSDVAVICPDNSPAAIWCDSHGIPHNP